MRVVVTGASGRVGRHCVRDLVAHDHDVLAVDIVAGETGSASMRVDLTDAGQVYGALGRHRAEAVVHLGAFPNPGLVPDAKTYGDNTQGTFNVFQACADLGVTRVVSASSAQVYGLRNHAPFYVRMDESHPVRPLNCYAESKLAGESAADYFMANFGLTILSFRIMGARTPDQMSAEIDRMAGDPGYGSWLLWTRTDTRDLAMACRKGVEAESVKGGIYNLTGPRIVIDVPVPQLVHTYFGDDVEVREDQDETSSPLSCEKARQGFGYDPQYAWTVKDRFEE